MIAVQLFNGKFFYCTDLSKEPLLISLPWNRVIHRIASNQPRYWGHAISTTGVQTTARECQGEFFQWEAGAPGPPAVLPRQWAKQQFHYDNVAAAMLTLFAVQTTEGWPA